MNIDSLIANNQALVDSNFKVVGQNSHPNANLLGYGPTSSSSLIKGCFQYSANGIAGNQVGPVIVYSSVPTCTAPTLSSIINNTSCSSLNDGSINLTWVTVDSFIVYVSSDLYVSIYQYFINKI